MPPPQSRRTIERGRFVHRQGVDGRPADLSRGDQRALHRGELGFERFGGGRVLCSVAVRARHRVAQPGNLALEPRDLGGTRLALPFGVLDRLAQGRDLLPQRRHGLLILLRRTLGFRHGFT